MDIFQYISDFNLAELKQAQSRTMKTRNRLVGSMSRSYWDTAEEFTLKALSEMSGENWRIYSRYVFPAIVFYCASFEAYLMEELTLFENEIIRNTTAPTSGPLLFKLNQIKLSKGDFQEQRLRVMAAYQLLRRQNATENLQHTLISQYLTLSRLRNGIIHFNPEFISIDTATDLERQAAVVAQVLSGTDDWTIWCRTLPVLLQARVVTKDMIGTFLRSNVTPLDEFFGAEPTDFSARRKEYLNAVTMLRTQELDDYINAFDPDVFANDIKVELSVSGTYKRGDDETLDVTIYAPGISSVDPYLASLLRHKRLNTIVHYRRDMYHWQDMLEMYKQTKEYEQHVNQCAIVQTELARDFLKAYDKDKHRTFLREFLIEPIHSEKAIQTSLGTLVNIMKRIKQRPI